MVSFRHASDSSALLTKALNNAPKLDFHRFSRTLRLYPYALEGDISFFGDGARVTVAFELEEWALCMILSHGAKSAMLDGKRMQQPPKQSDFNQPSVTFLSFGCPSAGRFYTL